MDQDTGEERNMFPTELTSTELEMIAPFDRVLGFGWELSKEVQCALGPDSSKLPVGQR
jgi:hypothetical protein